MNHLSIRNLNCSLGKKKILNNISLELENGIYALIGPNGAGKTTMFRCILNLYQTQSDIELNGIPKGQADYPYKIGFSPQIFSAFNYLTVQEMMQYYANLQRISKDIIDARIIECLDYVHLTEQAEVKVGKLSGGMLRRLSLAQAILSKPALLILDEPTVGLDIKEHREFLSLIQELSRTTIIIMSSHTIMDFEDSGTHIILLLEGNIRYEGLIEEMAALENGDIEKAYYRYSK